MTSSPRTNSAMVHIPTARCTHVHESRHKLRINSRTFCALPTWIKYSRTFTCGNRCPMRKPTSRSTSPSAIQSVSMAHPFHVESGCMDDSCCTISLPCRHRKHAAPAEAGAACSLSGEIMPARLPAFLPVPLQEPCRRLSSYFFMCVLTDRVVRTSTSMRPAHGPVPSLYHSKIGQSFQPRRQPINALKWLPR